MNYVIKSNLLLLAGRVNLLLLLTLLFFSCSNSIDLSERAFWERERVKTLEAKIKFEKHYEFNYKYGEVDSNSKFLAELREFDEQGNLKKQVFFNKEGLPPDTAIFYNNLNNCAEYSYRIFHYKNDTVGVDTVTGLGWKNPAYKEVVKRENKYDDKFNLVHQSEFKDKVLVKVNKFEFNDKNLCVKHIVYNPDNTVQSAFVFEYNKDGRLVLTKQYNAENELLNRKEAKEIGESTYQNTSYNPSNEAVESVEKYKQTDDRLLLNYEMDDKVGKMKYKFIHKYDKKKLLESVTYFDGAEPSSFTRIERVKFK